jgi:uncharacterized protein
MAVSLYDFSVPIFTTALTNISAELDKAMTHSEGKKADAKAFADARLIADMLPLRSQVGIACDTAKGCVARLAGVEPPKHEDNETTLPELKARVAKTLDFIKSIKPAQLEGDDSREIVMKFPNTTFKFTAKDYITKFALPNFYFHATMVYAILRKNGVELGKGDFLGAIQ